MSTFFNSKYYRAIPSCLVGFREAEPPITRNQGTEEQWTQRTGYNYTFQVVKEKSVSRDEKEGSKLRGNFAQRSESEIHQP